MTARASGASRCHWRRRSSPETQATRATGPNAPDAHLNVVDGRLAGGWSREVKGRAASVTRTLLRPLAVPERAARADQVGRYAGFLRPGVSVAT